MSDGQRGPSLTDLGIVAARQLDDEIVRERGTGCGFDFLACRAAPSARDVIRDGLIEDDDFLADQGHLLPHAVERQIAEVDVVDFDAAILGIVEAKDEIERGGLAATAFASQPKPEAARDFQTEVMQHDLVAEAEGDLVEGDFLFKGCERLGLGWLLDRGLLGKEFFQPLHAHARLFKKDVQPRQLFHRLEKESDAGEERDQILRAASGLEDVKQENPQTKHRDHLNDRVDEFFGFDASHAGMDDFAGCSPEARHLLLL